eukprot:s1025_g3.t1
MEQPSQVRRVFLLRHGEAEHNVSDEDVPDAPLTARGRGQANAWRDRMEEYDFEVVLLSPLTRAIQTACYAFQEEEDVPLVVVRSARELWWEDVANQPGPLESVYKRLEQLPRGHEVQALEAALSTKDAGTEAESIRHFRTVLAKRPEKTIAVVTHWGVINALCRQSADNCEMMECLCDGKGDLTFVRKHHRLARKALATGGQRAATSCKKKGGLLFAQRHSNYQPRTSADS